MARKMISNGNFMFGTSDIKSLPDESVPEAAFAGRSNVGKSSLINLLIHSKKAARVSSKPGCTRQINFYSMYNDKLRLVDLPGYGYSCMSKKETMQYLNLIEYYLTQRRNLKKVFVLVDSKVGLKEIDKDFIYWLTYNNINFDVVLTKIDKVGQKNLDIILESTQKWVNNENISIHQMSTLAKPKIGKLRNEFFKFTRSRNEEQ